MSAALNVDGRCACCRRPLPRICPECVASDPPSDHALACEDFHILRRLIREIGITATRRRLGIGADTLDRLCFYAGGRPIYRVRRAVVQRVRSRLIEWETERNAASTCTLCKEPLLSSEAVSLPLHQMAQHIDAHTPPRVLANLFGAANGAPLLFHAACVALLSKKGTSQ